MPIPTTPKNLPSIKRYLFQAYNDLNSIEQNVFGPGWDDEVSTLERAVILLEDRRYYTHRGIDIRSIIRELVKTLTFRKHGGASTIEMQFVRTCTGYKEISLRRKVYEMFLAWALLHRANKLEILRSYLRIAYFGTGLRGSEVASNAVFK
jgi:membrane peptidoglycan carboxypeptidase